MSYNGKRYDDEFKAEVMRLVREGGRSVNDVAKNLCINPQALRNCLGEDNKSRNHDKERIMEHED